jgi:TetR/AcrR family transcriptional repressor of nem operon
MKPAPNNLGRPRSFDEAEALDRATQVFWSNGYAGTTYPALESATGLHRQSLRYAFGDKAALFERVIDHYADRKVGGVTALLQRPGAALDSVKAVFALWARDANHPSRSGCLMVNALTELGNDGGVATKAINRANQTLIDAFVQAFTAAQEQGSVRTDLNPQVLARQAVAMGDGFMVHGRSGGIAEFADETFASFLSQIAT